MLEQILQSLEARLHQWRQRWSSPNPTQHWRDEADRLAAEIEQTQTTLSQTEAMFSTLNGRVEENRRQAGRLRKQVADCVKAGYESQAWPFVTELEQVNRALAADEADLPRWEQLCWSHRFRLRQLYRELERVEERLHWLKPSRQ